MIGGSALLHISCIISIREKGSAERLKGFNYSVYLINEPVFGLPIVLNPIMFIPFVFVPVINAIIGYFATSWGLVNHYYKIEFWCIEFWGRTNLC